MAGRKASIIRSPDRPCASSRARRSRRSCIYLVQSARRLLRLQSAGSRGDRGRYPQRGGDLEQGAARQRGAAVRRAGLCGRRGRGDGGRAVRAAEEENCPTSIRARSMPAGPCCSKAGSTGSRCRCRPRTWTSWRPSIRRRARSRWPSACRRCCWRSPATILIRTIRKPIGCSGAPPCCLWRAASARR